MAKKRRMRKTGAFNAPEQEEVKKEVATTPVAPPAPAAESKPVVKPEAPKKTLTSWLKGSPKEE
jgi:hypothetical protein